MADNKTIQKIFSLSDYRKKQLVGEIVERTRETYREYGYFGGNNQQSSPYSTIISRIDFSNDTVVANRRGNIVSAARGSRATGNSNFGYFGGGYVVSTVNRIDYSNDSTNATVRGPLALSAEYQAATGNSNFGYFAGGGVNAAGFDIAVRSIVSRIDYSNDTNIASRRGDLVRGRAVAGAVSNVNFSYFAGGTNYAGNWNVCCPVSAQTNIDRLSFSNDTVRCLLRNNFTTNGRILPGAVGNSSYAWFTAGAQYNSGLSQVDRLNYSNDTQTLSARGPLTSTKLTPGSAGNSNFGWVGGGGFLITGTLIDRIDYSNDTVTASARGNIIYDASAATSSASFGGSPNSSYASNFTFPTVPNAGYFGGGSDGTSDLASIDKIDYANDTTTASVRGSMSSAGKSIACVGNSNFGYFCGSEIPGGALSTSRIDRLEYSSDTQSNTVRGPLSLSRCLMGSTGNQNFGYLAGGFFGPVSTIDRIDYSNDLATASARSSLSSNRHNISATGTSNFGYFGGGRTPGSFFSLIQRIDYSNDTLTPLSRSPFSSGAHSGHGATGNSNFGYFGGGGIPNVISTVDRLDYSNDNASTSIRGPLSSAKEVESATGNSNFAYFGAGTDIAVTRISIVDRINYSNDTAIASIRGPLSTAKNRMGATSPLEYGGAPIYSTNPLPEVFQKQITFNDSNTLDLPFKRALGSYGYWAGGGSDAPTIMSTIQRIDYSNDLARATVRGPLSASRGYSCCSSGNSNYFWTFAGQILIGGASSIVDRSDFSNDTSIATLRVNLSNRLGASTGNKNFTYYGGGAPLGSGVRRLDYSNDTLVTSRGPLSLARTAFTATGNNNFGYFGGGNPGSGATESRIDRIDYSNDSVRASIRGNLDQSVYGLASIGNSNFGYFAGGFTGSAFISSISRVNYSNDTVTTSSISKMSTSRYAFSGNSNNNYGWLSGGAVSGTTIDRLDFSNDALNATVRGNIFINNGGFTASTSNARSS
jgi:hypothetical protein